MHKKSIIIFLMFVFILGNNAVSSNYLAHPSLFSQSDKILLLNNNTFLLRLKDGQYFYIDKDENVIDLTEYSELISKSLNYTYDNTFQLAKRKIIEAQIIIYDLIEKYQNTNQVVFIDLIRYVFSRLKREEVYYLFVYETEYPERMFASRLYPILNKYIEDGQIDEHIELFKLCMEFVVFNGWYNDIGAAMFICKKLQNNPLISLLKKAVLLRKILNDFEISRGAFNKELIQTSSLDVLEDNIKSNIFSILQSIFNTQKISYETVYRDKINQLFLDEIGSDDVLLWDLIRNRKQDRKSPPINFFGLLLRNYPTENADIIQKLFSVFKNSNVDVRDVIIKEMEHKHSLITIIQKFESYASLKDSKNFDDRLFFSEFYLTGGNAEWVDAVDGIGYLIVRRDIGWVSLYNTKTGEIVAELGQCFDIKLIYKVKDNLYFKVKLRDGWHIFDLKTGLSSFAFDSIDFCGDAESNAAFFSMNKESKIFLYTPSMELVSQWENGSGLQFLTDCEASEKWFKININGSWYLFNLQEKSLLEPVEDIEAIKNIKDSRRFVEIVSSKKEHFIYDVKDKKLYPYIPNVKNILLACFDDIYVENLDGEIFAWRNRDFKEIPRDLFEHILSFHKIDRHKYMGIKSYGMERRYLRNELFVRYEFTMELQGRYYISQFKNRSKLELHSTAAESEGWGFGDSVELIPDADSIQFIGADRSHMQSKAYFAIRKHGKLFLGIDKYEETKFLLEHGRKKENSLIQGEIDGEDIVWLMDGYFKIKKHGKWYLFNPFKATEEEPVDDIEIFNNNYIKIKNNGLWYLYDKSHQKIIDNIDGAKNIVLSAEGKIVFIYDGYVRYMRYDYMPDGLAVLENIRVFEEPAVSKNYMANLMKAKEYSVVGNNLAKNSAHFLLAYLEPAVLTKIDQIFIDRLEEDLEFLKSLTEFAAHSNNIINGLVNVLYADNLSFDDWRDWILILMKNLDIDQKIIKKHYLTIFKLLYLRNDLQSFLKSLGADADTRLSYISRLDAKAVKSFFDKYKASIKSEKEFEKFLLLCSSAQELEVEIQEYEDYEVFKTKLSQDLYNAFASKMFMTDDEKRTFMLAKDKWNIELLPDLWYGYNVMDEKHRLYLRRMLASNSINPQEYDETRMYESQLLEQLKSLNIDIFKKLPETTFGYQEIGEMEKIIEILIKVYNQLAGYIRNIGDEKIKQQFSEMELQGKKEKDKKENLKKILQSKMSFLEFNEFIDKYIALLERVKLINEKWRQGINKFLKDLYKIRKRQFVIASWDRVPSNCLVLGKNAQSCIALDRPNKEAVIDYIYDKGVQIWRLFEVFKNGLKKEVGYLRTVFGIDSDGDACIFIDGIEIPDFNVDIIMADIIRHVKRFAFSIGVYKVIMEKKFNKTGHKYTERELEITKLGGSVFGRIYLHSFFKEGGDAWVYSDADGCVKEKGIFCILLNKQISNAS